MLLQKLIVKNIRSYQDQVINFPAGSTILAGDIGTGKSSLLLAIEFALFGTSRPDLPGEALLRKGTTQASVELTFQIEKKVISIKRNLKKEKRGVKQLPGHFIVNGIKRELMPVELKAEIITMLGYPEELISKNKNYIFRYTIYTPQEEMKLILQENAETRLDVLRKIFNIDKYKIIRENLQLVLKNMRTKIAVKKTRLEPFEEIEEKLQQFKQEKQQRENNLSVLLPNKKKIIEQKEKSKNQINFLQKLLQEFQLTQQNLKTIKTRIEEKEQQVQELKRKQAITQENIAAISTSEETSKEQLSQEISEIETKQKLIAQQNTMISEKIKAVQEKMSVVKQECTILNKKLESFDTIKEKISILQEQKEDLQELEGKREKLENLHEKTLEIVTKNHTLLSESEKKIGKVQDLQMCPTCLQAVNENHKHKIISEEEQKRVQAKKLLEDLETQRTEILQQKKEIAIRIKTAQNCENELQQLHIQVKQQNEVETTLLQKKLLLSECIQQNTSLIQQQASFDVQKIERITILLQNKKSLYEHLLKKEFSMKQLEEIEIQIHTGQEKIRGLLKQQLEIQQDSINKQDPSEQLAAYREEYERNLEQEKQVSLKETEIRTALQSLNARVEELQQQVTKLMEEKNKLVREKEVYHWLNAHFNNVTHTIEKHVMLHIHQLFQQLFQEWFSMLIDDDTMTARIDDTFSPVIEQNGYEINFTNLSGGERTSAALAYRLALNKVINDIIHEVKTKDVIILDEPTDGFSAEQLDKVRDVIEKLNVMQTIIVSHESKIESFVENIIRVQKQGHVSSVI